MNSYAGGMKYCLRMVSMVIYLVSIKHIVIFSSEIFTKNNNKLAW